jgi:hypothetical protein
MDEGEMQLLRAFTWSVGAEEGRVKSLAFWSIPIFATDPKGTADKEKRANSDSL